MSIESQADLHGLRRAGDVTRLTLDALEAHVRAGITTADQGSVVSSRVRLAAQRERNAAIK
jgi:hypothetical protein